MIKMEITTNLISINVIEIILVSTELSNPKLEKEFTRCRKKNNNNNFFTSVIMPTSFEVFFKNYYYYF